MSWDWLDDFWWTYQSVVYVIGIDALLGLSIYLVLITGQLFLAQTAFMAIGAYVSALATLNLGLPFPLSLACGVGISAGVAIVISLPMLRLSGVYLGIGTIAFGEVLRTVVINVDVLGGALGLSGIPQSAGLVAIYGSLAAALLLCFATLKSKLGRALEMTRTNEVAAMVVGINTFRVKLAAVTASSALAGLAGGLAAHSRSSVSPSDFSFQSAVEILSFAVLGGTASPLGPVLGALVLNLLPEVLPSVGQYRTMLNGLVIVAVVAFRPNGLLDRSVPRLRRHA
jgi:branched-chain amino acid transport system permease protein